MRESIMAVGSAISNHSPTNINQRYSPGAIAAVLMIIGAALRIWQYAAGVSLWIDEIAVARNFIERPLSELLTTPLDFGQVAPRGFVLVEKLAVSTFGANDYALRLFPLLCSLIAMVVFWLIAEITLSRTGALVALALFATAAPLVIYGGQVKQYSGDVLVALWLLLLTLWSPATQWSHWQAVRIGAAGFVAVFFSHPAVFVVAGLAAAFWLSDRPDRNSTRSGAIRPFMIILILWAVAAVTGVLLGIASLTPGGQVFLPNFWARGFPPTSLYEAIATGWPWRPLKSLLNGQEGLVTLGYRYTTIVLFLMALGCVWIGRNKKRNLALIVAPIGVTLVAAILRQYPFSDRLIIFLIPNFLLLIAAGIASASARLARVSRPLATITALYCAGAGMWPIVRQPPPYGIEDAKPVLSYLQSHRMPDDVVYIYYGAWQAAQYYGPRYDLMEGNYFAGDCYRGYPRRYLEELDLLRGRRRVWVVIIHALWNYGERDDIVAYLDTVGVRRDHFAAKSNYFRRRTGPAELFLFDLGDAERLRRASAETFEIRGRTSIDPSLPCSIHERPIRPTISREMSRP